MLELHQPSPAPHPLTDPVRCLSVYIHVASSYIHFRTRIILYRYSGSTNTSRCANCRVRGSRGCLVSQSKRSIEADLISKQSVDLQLSRLLPPFFPLDFVFDRGFR